MKFPNYKAGIAIGDRYTASEDGWIFCLGVGRRMTTINGHPVFSHQLEYGGTTIGDQSVGIIFPISKGETYINRWDGNSKFGYAVFYPCK